MTDLNTIILIGTLFLSLVSAFMASLAFKSSSKSDDVEIKSQLSALDVLLKQIDPTIRNEGRASREELGLILSNQNIQAEARFTSLADSFEARFTAFSQSQIEQAASFRKETIDGREQLEKSLKRSVDTFSEVQKKELENISQITQTLSESLLSALKDARDIQERALQTVTNTIKELIETNSLKQDSIKESLNTSLEQLRKGNEEKLEQMRLTVDEKLQGTLVKRIGDSFQMVNERLEQVHKGLGEMQVLATGVGDLKRVLTNVKSRGGWGEVQLAMLLEDMLTKDQYISNAKIMPTSSEIVEFAIRLPGKTDDVPVLLPIDAKFPHEDYDRLLQAQDIGNADEIFKATAALEKAIKAQAKIISEKYIHPPHSTDFAIMYLPTEGLFAEVIRIAGLVNDIQNKHRVVITGPTTLAALLNSLQMGFKTLAIEKRSSEVWQVLGEAKAEFKKYGDVWDKLKKQLETAQNTVEEAGKRTRAVERKLKDVEIVSLSATEDEVLQLSSEDTLED